MTKLRKFVMVGLMAVVVGGSTVTAYAATGGLDNNNLSESQIQEFREKRLESKKSIINGRVESGKLSREEADSIIARIEENMKSCDGSMQGRNRQNRENNDENLGMQWRNNNDENGCGNYMNENNENMRSRMGNMMNENRDGSGFRMGHHRNNR